VKTTRSIEKDSMPAPAFDEFFHEWFPDLARALALIVRDLGEGQEIAQEGFIRLYRNWSRMGSADHARNFVFRASINLARSHLRKRRPLELIGLGRTELFGSVSDGSEISNDRILFQLLPDEGRPTDPRSNGRGSRRSPPAVDPGENPSPECNASGLVGHAGLLTSVGAFPPMGPCGGPA
jgi:DNA-directed RNA polymerase specialized sigma24 family protein